MVFDASAKPQSLTNSINDYMFTGSPLQPLLSNIMIRVRMFTSLLLGDRKGVSPDRCERGG